MAKADDQSFTDKQRAFIANYLRCFNATEAAKRAGYSAKTANEQASRLLANVSIRAEIDRILDERMMGAKEVLDRLSDIGRSDIAQLMSVSSNGFSLDMVMAKELGLTKLIKRIKQKTITYPGKNGDEDREETTLEVELYDAQSALVTMGKQHGLFATKVELTVYDSIARKLKTSPEQARLIAERIRNKEITFEDVLTGKVKVGNESDG